MRQTLYMFTLAAALMVSPAFAQTLHVTSTHNGTEAEKTYHTQVRRAVIVGTIGDKSYTLSQTQSWGAYSFEVGTDYPVSSIGKDTVKVDVPTKKGTRSVSLSVEGVTEGGR